MTLPVRFHPLAEDDLVAAWAWYEERQRGLGDRLLAAVRRSVDLAAQWPNIGSPTAWSADGQVAERRAGTRGFPYVVRYRVIDGTLVVLAVYHQHRHPTFGTDRSS